jgi:hypothetical protein
VAMDFSWLPPGTDVNKLPLGMRVNNPSNIKYFKGLTYPGMLGPSGPGHTDQGDPQMTFDSPQSGMNAAGSLAYKKYKSGQRTPRQIIAGQRGWTPGNIGAAENVARTMGINLDDDLALTDPAKFQQFLRALTLQEHGQASSLYGDDVYSNAVTAATGGNPMPAQNSYLAEHLLDPASPHYPRRPKQMIGGTAATASPGPMPVALPTAPTGRHNKLADALLAAAAGAKPRGWGDLINAAGDLALGYTMSNRQEEEEKAYRSKLSEALMGAKDPDALVNTLLSSGDPNLQQSAVSMKVAQMKPKSEIGRFRPTKQGVVDTTTGQIVPGTEAQAGADAEFGTTPVPYEDKDGNIRYTQMSKAGGRKDVDLPEGAKWLPGIDYKDTGTGYTGINKKTGRVEGEVIPKDVAGEAARKAIGKEAGEATVALPAAKSMVENAFKTIAELEKHPGLETGTGLSNVIDPRSWTPGSDAYNFLAKNKQAMGQSFMTARESLKGAGQVTDFEGAKGEQAIANLDAAQSRDQYLEALKTLKTMMQASYDDLSRKASMAGGPQPAAPASADKSDPLGIR